MALVTYDFMSAYNGAVVIQLTVDNSSTDPEILTGPVLSATCINTLSRSVSVHIKLPNGQTRTETFAGGTTTTRNLPNGALSLQADGSFSRDVQVGFS